ncbi:MAG: 2-isopropylmalate synthase, partial [Clostridia bacterium]|nr:2-isopropylmalate synthase [Clostridia bacterium]
LSEFITSVCDAKKTEVTPQFIYDTFINNFLDICTPMRFLDYDVLAKKGETEIVTMIDYKGTERKYIGSGNGPLDAFMSVLNTNFDLNLEIAGYNEHALQHGSSSEAIAYVGVRDTENKIYWGAGSDTNISTASIKAVVSAVNRFLQS